MIHNGKDVDSMETFDIYFDELTPDAKEAFLRFYNITYPSDMNYDIFPIASLPRPEED
jgi:hypothetical protein